MGVASCASGACHGSTRPFASATVRQDEYFIWQRQDRHARAFETLRGEKSRRIASNLGLKDAAEASECLACHADAVPPPQRAKGHLLSDGVGCEVCHGGAERWLAPHTAGFKNDGERRRAGLFPAWEPAARARLCLSCHQGDTQRPMHHRLMGAGHPPLTFELDTFTTVMPSHHAVDADYRQRKGPQDGARNWLEGQAAAADLLLENLLAVQGQGGLFPELIHFDCNACHHSVSEPRWQPGIAAHLEPGSVRLADTAFRMLGYWLDATDPAQAVRWREAVARLHASTQEPQPALQDSVRALRELLKNTVAARTGAGRIESAQVEKLLRRLLRDHREGPAGADFSSAEQATMAVAVLCTALSDRDTLRITPAVKAALDALYASVGNRDRFNPAEFRKALARAETALPARR